MVAADLFLVDRYALLTFAMSVGAMFTGVMCDTVVVETSMRYEVKDDKGQIQTVRRHDIAAVRVAFFSRCQRYRC